jgi:hypothetical protein
MIQSSSPASTGSAGSNFEGQVGASYLLSLLAGTEPRGLPGTRINRVQFQAASDGHPLDDVIIHAQNRHDGSTATLAIQVKRSISFAPQDAVFQKISRQIAQTVTQEGFWDKNYQMAIAVAKITTKIEASYQEVLHWARHTTDATAFFARIERRGTANDDMRQFVKTFRSNLQQEGQTFDNDMLFRILQRLQILVFDFTEPGGQSLEPVLERARNVLSASDAASARALWGVLTPMGMRTATAAGDRTLKSLQTELQQHNFGWAGQRQYFEARQHLKDDAQHALQSIYNTISGVSLLRPRYVETVESALDVHQYVEIRGEPGVGKSAILRHLAEKMATESRIVVLSPTRTPAEGWAALRLSWDVTGTARNFLWDLAADGGSTLFIDNLDDFEQGNQETVKDMVREALQIPSFKIVATARTNFDTEQRSWLADVLEKARATTSKLTIEPLSDDEIHELREALPALSSILANNHPARNLLRNLFNLSYLAQNPLVTNHNPLTEAGLAKAWWETGGDTNSQNQYVRQRIMNAFARQAVQGQKVFNGSNQDPSTLQSLVKEERLQKVRIDHFTFRHDVLKEWAMANALLEDRALLASLPLQRSASASFYRAIELLGCLTLELPNEAVSGWNTLLNTLSAEGVNASWRRAVLMSLVRTEDSHQALNKVRTQLLENKAALLCELIRTVKAVDTEPLEKKLATLGLPIDKAAVGIGIPNSVAWIQLIRWIVALGEELPAYAIDDVQQLYFSWSYGMYDLDEITPTLVKWQYHWLRKIELSDQSRGITAYQHPFNELIHYRELEMLETNLRASFVLFSHRVPDLAIEYLQLLQQGKHNDSIVHSLLKSPGTLARAAPEELAKLTLHALKPKPRRRSGSFYDSEREQESEFSYADSQIFYPASPTKGVFWGLLNHAPTVGKKLIRDVIAHALSYHRLTEENKEGFTLPLATGNRHFPYYWTYFWAREWSNARANCVTSGLMALEAWAYERLDKGEDFSTIIADILVEGDAPAAYLLLAVDLILSHWPKSAEAAVPFLACPELLCLDRERLVHDAMDTPAYWGDSTHHFDSFKRLKERRLKGCVLDDVLGIYAVTPEYAPSKEQLVRLLTEATLRLGAPEANVGLNSPTLMARHALNRLSAENYQQATQIDASGTEHTGWQYVTPPEEDSHFKPLQDAQQSKNRDANISSRLMLVLENPSQSSPEFAAAAVEWAKEKQATDDDTTEYTSRPKQEVLVMVAMVAMRDGDDALRQSEAAWAEALFLKGLKVEIDHIHYHRTGLAFNQPAIAFAGMVHMLPLEAKQGNILFLLEAAAQENPAVVHGFQATISKLKEIDERLPRAVLRCGLTACVKPVRTYDVSERDKSLRNLRYQQLREAAVAAELAWLKGEMAEQAWPSLEERKPRKRRGIRLPGGKPHLEQEEQPKAAPETYTNHQGGALWLHAVLTLDQQTKCDWLPSLVQAYAQWTAIANGSETRDDVDNKPYEWNNVYYRLLARSIVGSDNDTVTAVALNLLCSLPDEPFLDSLTAFLLESDVLYFDHNAITVECALHIRTTLAERILKTRNWSWIAHDRRESFSIDRHLAAGLAALFFSNGGFSPLLCYLRTPQHLEKAIPFIPVMQKLIEAAPCGYTTIASLNLLEVVPLSAYLEFILKAAKIWLHAFPNSTTFWLDYGVGRRVCTFVTVIKAIDAQSVQAHQEELESLLAGLTRVGIAEAAQLESTLAVAL